MNIRKFTGPTSRDALRLVREALGGDAVVLSNRTLDDGSVEIVALADAELAALSPKSPIAAAGSMRALPPASRPASAVTGMPRAAAPNNPYASGGLPDVFSSVFGASAEPAGAFDADDELLDDGEAPAATVAAAPAQDEPAASSAPAPWLVEHARRLTRQHEALVSPAPRAEASPGAASPIAPAARNDGEPPEWARDIVRNVAARQSAEASAARATAAAAAAPKQAERAGASAATLADEVNARIERIVNETVMHELSAMRGMMEEQFAGLMWNDRQRRTPLHGALTKRLFAAGFSAQLVRTVVDNLPAGVSAGSFEGACDWAESVLAGNLPVLDSEDALMERGGVFALMGPTGVGKTTTTAKLAARCVMRFGASKVALLTTDSYRIGGHEQLRIFGRILGVPVHAVKDGGDLQLALSELRNKHIVLIDTIGMSQRDRTVSDQIAMLQGADARVQRLLLLAATSHGDTLNEVVQAYRGSDQPDLAGCILTKLDEATNLGGVLDTVIRYQLPVHYVSTGQKVPENLYVATRKFLLKSAFCVPRDGSPFVPLEDDLPGMLSALAGGRPGSGHHEVYFG
ncbi:flagellar biosynthesis protein FlhF [Burkholderia glumae]|uniref:flagellar biosynthesis protein FlhF n=1 Tax=Burkholderia glumae TaxID=337 RepID=UPI002036FCB3|nr:flagellar biosynthesis protein FlhF [Burkholderia glumae]MCM2491722.1 flagellar biosynthesis protein FlhF [Burkholderia glumae]MCM2542710.1 flagellar biosynthesis protein FlhF [Burkholderia glumae]UVS94446.1 flagellar biosynthesis protein FlhF [Burkholderia glumae]